jgi:hypothetical protein
MEPAAHAIYQVTPVILGPATDDRTCASQALADSESTGQSAAAPQPTGSVGRDHRHAKALTEARVAPSERFRAELDEALAGVGAEQDPVEVVGRWVRG